MQGDHKEQKLTRRHFLGTTVVALAGLAPVPGWAQASPGWIRSKATLERALSFSNIHTGERLTTVYYANGRYIPAGLKQINHLLRDYRIDEVKGIDPRLIDLLYALRSCLGVDMPFKVLSGYRSPSTNAMLRRERGGVAKHSLHIEGKAVDICLEGWRATDIARAAWQMQGGGVGLYPAANFVHLDVGDVRTWVG